MGTRSYATDRHVRKLVEKGGFEEKAACAIVSVMDKMVTAAKAAYKSSASKADVGGLHDSFKPQSKAQGEYFDTTGISPYCTVSLARELVEDGGLEWKAAAALVSVAHEIILETFGKSACKTEIDGPHGSFTPEIKTQSEHIHMGSA